MLSNLAIFSKHCKLTMIRYLCCYLSWWSIGRNTVVIHIFTLNWCDLSQTSKLILAWFLLFIISNVILKIPHKLNRYSLITSKWLLKYSQYLIVVKTLTSLNYCRWMVFIECDHKAVWIVTVLFVTRISTI